MRPRTAMLAGFAGVATTAGFEYQRARRSAGAWQRPAGEHGHAGALAVRTLGDTGSPVLLLHGLVASGIFWGGAYDRLVERHRLVVPDLLGFGGSDRPDGRYGPDDHVQAVVECLDVLGVHEPVTIGAHSLGCVVGLRMAATHPERVAGLVGFGPPIYANRTDARARIGSSGPMARLFALPGPVGELSCKWVCDHRAVAARLAAFSHPRLPGPIAAAAVEHDWASYSRTLTRVILDAEAADWLPMIEAPVQLVAGNRDPVVDREFLSDLGSTPGIALQIWSGRHDLPLVEAKRCATAIVDALDRRGPSRG
ncbi:MAG: alpha/beta fold hydrolase [Acidimicrobiales bacterium]